MKKTIFSILFAALLSFLLGIFCQKNHVPLSIKHLIQGYPLYSPPPQNTILDWDYKKTNDLRPKFMLNGLPFQEIGKNRPLYISQLKRILRMSEFPESFDSKTKVLERVELEKVYREKISIETEPGLWIPFYFFVPKGEVRKYPVIFILHGHGRGKLETAGLVSSYQKSNALALAEEGFVTVAPDFRGFGESGWAGDSVDALGHDYSKSIHIQDVLSNIRIGRTVLGSYLFDLHKILAYVEKREEVDLNKMGVAGTSMGADVAIWFAALEERIRVVVACHPEILSYPYEPGDYGSFHACIHTLPRFRRFFYLKEIPFLICPRPLLIHLNKHKQASVNQNNIEGLYKEAGYPKNIFIELKNGGDVFYLSKAIDWFKKWL